MDIDIKRKCTYIAIKPIGFRHYLWFKMVKSTLEDSKFTGNEGWGKGGVFTEICINQSQIESVIYSESPQYS